MKSIYILCLLSIYNFCAIAQDFQLINSGDLIRKGVELHDEGNYEEALEYYRQVNRNDTNYLHALSEIATTYIAMEEYDTVIYICQYGLKEHSEVDYMFYNLLGTAYDETKQAEKSLEVYLRAVKDYPANSLLNFNIGITLLGMGRNDEAIESLKKAIDLNIYHPSSHYYLGKTLADQGRLAPAFLSLSMFVLLENNGARSIEIIKKLQSISSNGLDQPDTSYPEDQIFQELDLIIRSRIALKKEYKTQVKETDSYIKQLQVMCEKLPDEQVTDNFWMINYAPYFRNLLDSDFLPFHTYYVFNSLNNEKINKWLNKNKSKRSDFISWAESQLNLSKTNKAISINGNIQPVSYWFYDSGNLEAIGSSKLNNSGEKKFIGSWIFYHSTGNIKALGAYNNNGERTGNWKWYSPNGALNEIISYEDGVIQKTNLQYHTNGELNYEIPYKNGEIEGTAKQFSNSGALIFEGEYENGQNNGFEKYYFLNGNIQYHYFYKNGDGDSIARAYYSNGSLKRKFYLKNGKLNGPDTEYFENENVSSVGNFKNGIQTGPWKWYHENGKIQNEGELDENGNFVGVYKKYYNTGMLEEEFIYSEGKLNGKATKWDRNSNLLASYTYLDDELVEYTNFNIQGEILSTGKLKDGVLEFESFFPEGMKEVEGKYINKKKEGIWKKYYRNGNIDEEETYKEGKLDGTTKSYYKNGSLFAEYSYTNDVWDGFYKSYKKNGNTSLMGWYQMGQRQGDWYTYSPDGTIASHGYYLNDKPYGYQVYYRLDGKIHYEEFYKDDLLQYYNNYDTTGALFQKIELVKGNGSFKFLNFKKEIRLTGEYLNGLLEGELTTYLSSKQIRKKENNILGISHGLSEEYTIDGELKEKGDYREGEKAGEWFYYHDNGQLSSTGNYERGGRTGEWKWYYDTGELRRTGSFYDGYRDGIFTWYAPSGELMYRIYYVEGDYIYYSHLDSSGVEVKKLLPLESGKITCFYQSGTKSVEFELKSGNREGLYTEYYPNGNIMFLENYEAGQLNGISREFYSKSNIKLIESYYYGYKNGESIIYDINGNIKKVENFLFDSRHGDWIYYHNGLIKTTKKFLYGYLIMEE